MKQITISGTDRSNPRNAADIMARLEQIKRDTAAMREEVARLHVFAGRIRDVLMEQGRTERQAGEAVGGIRSLMSSLDDDLDVASDRAGRALDAVSSSKVIPSARFDWHPVR